MPGTPKDGIDQHSLGKGEEPELAQRNAEYLGKLDRGIEQMKAGNLQYHDLIEEDE